MLSLALFGSCILLITWGVGWALKKRGFPQWLAALAAPVAAMLCLLTGIVYFTCGISSGVIACDKDGASYIFGAMFFPMVIVMTLGAMSALALGFFRKKS